MIKTRSTISIGRIILLFALLPAGNISYGQLDTAEVILSFSPETDQYGNSYDELSIEATVDDSTDIGGIEIYVYDSVDEMLVGRIKKSIYELNTEDLISGDLITLTVPYLDDSISYTINIQLLTSSGAYIPLITTDYNPD